VLAGRSPKPGVSSTAHLVSVEHRYSATGFDLGPDRAGAKVRLVSLASWQFACLSADHTFAALARDLTPAPSALPDSGDPAADLYLRQGYVPARHRLRQGGRTVSWYRGPLLAGPVPAEPRRAARTSDALLRYHRDCGMFDTSLASAWQLGRLLALQHTAAASAIATWRRRRAQQAARQIPADHPLAVAEIDTALPPAAADLLTNLAGLDGVPFRYLVPDERLLPEESVRLFQVDRTWTEALVDGAFSVGRLTSADAELDRAGPPPVDIPVLSGALIRSTLISGYPSLKVDAYAGTRPLPVRLERLSPTMLLCLAEGVLTRLDLHQPQSAQHFGLASPPAGPRGTVSAAALAQSLGAADSAAFAARMTETAERVTFQV
jgi:hypothetical protein